VITGTIKHQQSPAMKNFRQVKTTPVSESLSPKHSKKQNLQKKFAIHSMFAIHSLIFFDILWWM